MKIAFLSAYHPSEKWSTPISLIHEFEHRDYEVKIFSTLENGKYTDKNLDSLVQYNPDLLIHTDWGRFLFPTLLKIRDISGFKVMEGGDEPQNFIRNITKARYFDLIYTPDYPSSLRYQDQGFNSVWLTHFADTRVHNPIHVKKKYTAVCSRGKGRGADLIDWLSYRYGETFVKNQNGWDAQEHSKFLCSGKMVLQQSRWHEITRRIFEAMACGQCVLTDRLPEYTRLQELFIENRDIVYYDSLDDLADKILYYDQHEEERTWIALNGYNKTIKFHTQVQRVDSILECYKKWKDRLYTQHTQNSKI